MPARLSGTERLGVDGVIDTVLPIRAGTHTTPEETTR